jgi:hypothetical protein
MALEKRFIERHILESNSILIAHDFQDAIDKQKWVAVRQQGENVLWS